VCVCVVCDYLSALSQVRVESTPGVGSTFYVYLHLPVHKPVAALASPAVGLRPAPCHILLVEDNPLNVQVCVLLLGTMVRIYI